MINGHVNGFANGSNGVKVGVNGQPSKGSNGHVANGHTNGNSKRKNWVNLDNINPCIKLLKHAVQG